MPSNSAQFFTIPGNSAQFRAILYNSELFCTIPRNSAQFRATEWGNLEITSNGLNLFLLFWGNFSHTKSNSFYFSSNRIKNWTRFVKIKKSKGFEHFQGFCTQFKKNSQRKIEQFENSLGSLMPLKMTRNIPEDLLSWSLDTGFWCIGVEEEGEGGTGYV